MPPHDAHGTSGNSRHRQDMIRQLPNEACKVKLAMYNSTEDWDVLFFEHHARKYGWTGYTLLKESLTQRFGVKDFSVCRKLGELHQGRDDAFLEGLRNQKVAYEVMN